MAEPSHVGDEAMDNQTAELGSQPSATTRSALLKRNPHLRDNQASPFGGLGSRQFLQKQLMTPGSATSASSFEEAASYDGFSDEGTPGTIGGKTPKPSVVHESRVYEEAAKTEIEESGEAAHYVTKQQPTKRLSSPSRRSLARRLLGTSTKTHGMFPDDDDAHSVESMAESLPGSESDALPPGEMLSNVVVRRVPALGELDSQSSSLSVSPGRSVVTRRIVSSPRRTLRRSVIRRTGADGQVHEEVQYLDAEGNVVQNEGGSFFSTGSGEQTTTTTSSSTTTPGRTVTRRLVSPGQTLRRRVVRKTGADGRLHEEVQYVDADGNVVEGADDSSLASTEGGVTTTSSTTSTPGRTTVTRRVVTPSKTTRRVLRRTGADGQVVEEVQYVDADGHVVQTDGGQVVTAGSGSSSSPPGSTSVTRRVVTPGRTLRRVIVRRTGADGQVHEDVQYLDAEGSVVQGEGGELVTSESSETVTSASSSPAGRSVTRRVVSPGQTTRRVIVRRTGADGQVREEVQCLDAEGNVVQGEGALSSSGSFTTEETGTPGRRKVTRRVVRRMRRLKDGSLVPADSTEQYLDADGRVIGDESGSLTRVDSFADSISSGNSDTSTGVDSTDGGALGNSGSFTRETSTSTPGRRVITRRVVTPQRVVRRMVVRKGVSGSTAESTESQGEATDLDGDDDVVSTEGGAGGSRRTTTTTTSRVVTPGKVTRRVVVRTIGANGEPQEVVQFLDAEGHEVPSDEGELETKEEGGVTTPTRQALTVVTEPVEGATSPEATQKIGLTPGVIWDYFTKSEDQEAGVEEPAGVLKPEVASPDSEEDKEPIPVSQESPDDVEEVETAEPSSPKEEASPSLLTAAVVGVTGATAAVFEGKKVLEEPTRQPSGDQEGEVVSPEEGVYSIASVSETSKPSSTTTTSKTTSTTTNKHPRTSSGGFWDFFGKGGHDKEAPVDEGVPTVTEELVEHDEVTPSDDEAAVELPPSPAASIPVKQTTSVRTELDTELPVSPSSVSRTVRLVQEAQTELPTTEDEEFKTPEESYEINEHSDTEEEKIPIHLGHGDIVDVPEVEPTAEIVEEEAPKSPIASGALLGATVAGVTAATVAIVYGSKTAEEEPFKPLPDVDEEVVTPELVTYTTTSVDKPSLPTKTRTTTSTTTTTTSKTAEESSEHSRTSGGGFWNFFGKSEEQPTVDGNAPAATEDVDGPQQAAPTVDEVVLPVIGSVPVEEVQQTVPDSLVQSPLQVTRSSYEVRQDLPDVDVGELNEPGAVVPEFKSSVVQTVETSVPIEDDEPTTPRSSVLLPAAVVGVTGAAITTAVSGLNSKKPEEQLSQLPSLEAGNSLDTDDDVLEGFRSPPVSISTTPVTSRTIEESEESEESEEKPRTSGGNGGGFWNFFGKSEEEEDTTPSSVELADRAVQGVQPQLPDAIVEPEGDATHSLVLPSEMGQAVPAFVAVADIPDVEPSSPTVLSIKKPEIQLAQHQPIAEEGELPEVDTFPVPVAVDSPSPSPKIATTTTTTTVTTEERSEELRGGFWGFFGKSEPKEPRSSDVETASKAQSAQQSDVEEPSLAVVDATLPVVTTAAVESPWSPSSVTRVSRSVQDAQQQSPSSGDGDMETPEGQAVYGIGVPSDSLPSTEMARDSIVDVPVPVVASAVETEAPKIPKEDDNEPKSPRDRHVLRTMAVAGVTGATAASVASALSSKEPVTLPTSDATPSGGRPVVVASTTTTVVQESSEQPRRKSGSVWKFWGVQKGGESDEDVEEKSTSPLPVQKSGVAVAVAPVVVAGVEPPVVSQPDIEVSEHAVAPRPEEARMFWHDQDKQKPHQPTYVAAVGATYGPESKFEPAKVRKPVVRSQVATVDSPRDESSPRRAVGWPAGTVVTTERTQITTEEVEPEVYEVHVDRDSPRAGIVAPAAGIAALELAKEREDVEPEAGKRGFWGFLGKKDTPEEPSPAVPAAGAFDNSGVASVTWEYEGEEAIEAAHEGKPAAVIAPGLEVQAIRKSITSQNHSPKNLAGVSNLGEKSIRESDRRTTVLIDGAEPDVELATGEHYMEVESPRDDDHSRDGAMWAVRPCTIAWSKLRLNRKSWKASPEMDAVSGDSEVVLNDVSGSVKAGEFLVITGPAKHESLALLSCLAGHQDAMEGNVTVNGRQWNEKMDRYIAYVQREDLFFETLTVHEHLVSQAQLRMKRTHTDEMCLERVESVINDMGLSSCRDQLIGGGISLRGITRGQRKLLALATALLTNPSILLVEEPTDGLDTFSAEPIVAKLRWLAFEKGLTVAVTLHHPSSHFYALFDILYLVADATCIYDGKAADAVAYFSTIGYSCPEYMSPMDFFLHQMVIGDRSSDDEGVARLEMLKREWRDRNAAVYAQNEARATAASATSVVDAYDQKNRYYHMGCCGQVWLLWARHIRRLSRYGFVFWWHLLAALLIGVIFGLVYLQLDLNDQQGIQNFAGAFFYVVVVQLLFVAYRTFVFLPRETAIALRERREYRGSWYHLLCWYLTKILAELPALILLSIVLFAPVFLLIGVGHGFAVYVYMQIVVVLAGWTAVSLAFLALGVLRRVTLALIVYSVLLLLFVAFGGLLINVTDIPDWLVWLHYVSPVKYGYEALMKIFWTRVDAIDCDVSSENCVARTGDGVLTYYSMENRSALGDTLIQLAICMALFFVAFWFLLVLAKKRVGGLQWRYQWTFRGRLGSRKQRSSTAVPTAKDGGQRRRIQASKSRHSSVLGERSTVEDGGSPLNHYIQVETPRVGGRGYCDAPAITLGWSSLWLKAPSDRKVKIDEETLQQQHLLSDASGSAKCGELVLITGPSEPANVALLESLGGLQRKLKGKVTMNGSPRTAQKTGEHVVFVARDDLFYETLTVQEHLRFHAQLTVGKSSGGCGGCCGSSASDLETERVELALDEMELTGKRLVLIRYLSPGDRKLLALATALLVNPSVLLVEEPTDELDFYSSQRVVLKLRQLARGGRTVVVTMTHPSSHLYALFDVLYLLAGGAAVYHGKVREAVPYFASLGYQCPQYMSPVDFFVRQVTTKKSDTDSGDAQAALFKEAWSTRYSELLCLAGDRHELEATQSGGAAYHRRRVGCCGQLSLLFRRHVLRLARYRTVFGWHALWMIVLGIVFGLIFLQLDLENQRDIQNWAGAFFFVVVLQMLVIAYRTFVFLPREMEIAEREHRGGGYYLVCWFLTKVLAELPALLVLSVLLFVPVYLLIGIGHGFKLYFYMQLVLWLSGWSAAGLASLLLGIFRRVKVALLVYALLLVLFVVFGGLLVNVDDVPDYLIWLHYISPVKYGYEALMKLFWGRIAVLACGESDGSGSGSGSATFATVGADSFSASASGSAGDDCIARSGAEVLKHYSMDESRDARSDTIILLELTVLYFFIGYAFLSLRWRRYKIRQERHPTKSPIDN